MSSSDQLIQKSDQLRHNTLLLQKKSRIINIEGMLNLTSLDLKSFLFVNILINTPFSLLFLFIALLFCGFKNKISTKAVLKYMLFQTLIDTTIGLILQIYNKSEWETMPYLISSTILMIYLFNLDFLSSLISNFVAFLANFVIQMSFLLVSSFVLKMSFDDISNLMDTNPISRIIITYACFIVMAIILIVMYKKNIKIIDIKKYKLFSYINNEIEHDFIDNIKIIAIVVTPIAIFLVMSYSFYYSYTNVKLSFPLFLTLNSMTIIVSNILMFFLVRKIIKLRYYKADWTSQQKYLYDINELLKRLRAQKHGFINHMNIIYGLMTLKEYDNAKDYLSKIHETISTNNVVLVDNPTLSALLNVKSGIAEKKGIKFEVNSNDNLSEMNFKAFEIGEAMGNIIDNAFDAANELEEDNKFVRVNISSDNNFYIFDIQNSGNPIPENIINRIFEQGFSTKDYESEEHGFGLYISKNIIEYHQGKIEVISKENITSFKVYLPKVIKNEFKAS